MQAAYTADTRRVSLVPPPFHVPQSPVPLLSMFPSFQFPVPLLSMFPSSQSLSFPCSPVSSSQFPTHSNVRGTKKQKKLCFFCTHFPSTSSNSTHTHVSIIYLPVSSDHTLL